MQTREYSQIEASCLETSDILESRNNREEEAHQIMVRDTQLYEEARIEKKELNDQLKEVIRLTKEIEEANNSVSNQNQKLMMKYEALEKDVKKLDDENGQIVSKITEAQTLINHKKKDYASQISESTMLADESKKNEEEFDLLESSVVKLNADISKIINISEKHYLRE